MFSSILFHYLHFFAINIFPPRLKRAPCLFFKLSTKVYLVIGESGFGSGPRATFFRLRVSNINECYGKNKFMSAFYFALICFFFLLLGGSVLRFCCKITVFSVVLQINPPCNLIAVNVFFVSIWNEHVLITRWLVCRKNANIANLQRFR